jgi:hypothetical protein
MSYIELAQVIAVDHDLYHFSKNTNSVTRLLTGHWFFQLDDSPKNHVYPALRTLQQNLLKSLY